MKKLLLSATAAILSFGSVFAVTDGETYAPTNGIECKSIWILDRVHNDAGFKTLPIVSNYSRTACIAGDIVYVAGSLADEPGIVDDKGVQIGAASLDKFSLTDGSYLGRLKLTIDGVRHSGLLCANQVGVDSFGNLWVAPYTSELNDVYQVYTVDTATGAMTLRADLTKGLIARIDYCDLVGDITLAQAKCTLMAVGANSQTVYRWVAEQGGDATTWEGGWDGDPAVNFMSYYPSKEAAWGTGPSVKIVLGEDDKAYEGELYYLDGFYTHPILYDLLYSIIDSFETAPELTPAESACTGISEFVLAGKSFVAYPNAQYEKGAHEAFICEMGAGPAFAGMQKYWQIPNNGLGGLSDGGTRIHSLDRKFITDTNGKEGVLLMSYKCQNGLGVYLIAEEGFVYGSGVENTVIGSNATITVNGSVITVSEEASEIAIFNLAGQTVAKVSNATEISAPVAGAYIVKAMVAGAPVVKKVVL